MVKMDKLLMVDSNGDEILFEVTDTVARNRFGDYVTPEMFGAKGDGVTDDTQAVQTAFDSGKSVLLVNSYYITAPLQASENLCVFGCDTKAGYQSRLIFSNAVKVGIIVSTPNIKNSVSFEHVSFYGTNNQNQVCFVNTRGSVAVSISLFNCIVHSFDAVFAGYFVLSRSINCSFYRIAKALILGNTSTKSYSTHNELCSAILEQITGSLVNGMGESTFTDCYISGQGGSYNHVGLFVGCAPYDVKFTGCYIDYWTAIAIDSYLADANTEPLSFVQCTLDSIITIMEQDTSVSSGAGYILQGIHIVNCLICRFNSSFNSNVQVNIYDFIRIIDGQYYRMSNIHIVNCQYVNTSTNANLSQYKFININDYYFELRDCIFDFTVKYGINIGDIVTLQHASYDMGNNVYTTGNKFPILNYKVYDTMPKVNLRGQSDSFNGHIFIYDGNAYMNVNGTAYKINNA